MKVFSFFPASVEVGKSGSIRRKRSHLSLNGSRPSSFIGRNGKVGAASRPDIENGVIGTGKMELLVPVKQNSLKMEFLPVKQK
jgi:hypothetical protein